ncbi:MAG: ABC transporter ATP-binding protein [Bacteroidota bacterium]|nr:ABC transporter ATP-binding protein [Bacteroidota bacterium]
MESNIAIKVNNLGKAYRIGLREEKSETLIDAVMKSLRKPFENFRNLTNLRKFKNDMGEEDIFWANRNISFDVKEGEVLGIIGKNGAGKSTLLKLLSRITEPTEGRIEIYGNVSSLLEVGTGFNPELTGKENIYLNGTILGLTKKEVDERYDEIVEFSGIEQFIETPVKRYSSGMKVRLAFAVAAHLDPEILIIDEVLAVGDAEFQKKCLGKVQSVASKEGRTVLFVSHDMAAIKNLCTRAILLQRGKIVADGAPAEVVDYYLKNAALVNEKPHDLNTALRKGSGKFRVTDMEFLNGKLEEVTALESGMDLNIKVYYKCYEKPVNPVINIIIKNSLQVEVVNLLSRISHYGVIKLQEEGFVICHIPKFPLMPGRYSIDVFLKYDFELTDKLEDVITFDVEKGDFYGTGKLIDSMKNGVLVDHSWKIDEQ